MQYFLYLIYTIASLLRGSMALKCYLCNTAYSVNSLSEIGCRNPGNYPDFKPVECSRTVLSELRKSWGNEEWNWALHSGHKNPVRQEAHDFRLTPSTFGYEKKEGYELKCMKEVLHKFSKAWLLGKPDNFSQIVRFCEYRRNGDCVEECSSGDLEEGTCSTCCGTEGCNGGRKLSPIWIVKIPIFSFLILKNLVREL